MSCIVAPHLESRRTERIIHEKKSPSPVGDQWLGSNRRLIQSHALFVFGINRLLICYSWILLMTGAVNSRTEQKPIITLSAHINLSACGRGAVYLRKRNKNTLISHGGEKKKNYFFFLSSISSRRACQHIDFTDKSGVSKRLV